MFTLGTSTKKTIALKAVKGRDVVKPLKVVKEFITTCQSNGCYYYIGKSKGSNNTEQNRPYKTQERGTLIGLGPSIKNVIRYKCSGRGKSCIKLVEGTLLQEYGPDKSGFCLNNLKSSGRGTGAGYIYVAAYNIVVEFK